MNDAETSKKMTNTSDAGPVDAEPGQSFAQADARLALTQQRFSGFDLETVTLARLVNFVSKGLANSANRALKGHGLNHTGYAVMVMLYGSPEFTLTPSELVEATHEKSANITRICDDLVRQGYIDRTYSEQDRRKVQVRLTEPGIARIRVVLPDLVSVTQGSFALLDDAERQQLNRLLRKAIAGQERLT